MTELRVAEDTKSLRSCDESEASGSDTLSPCKKQGDDQYPKGNKTRGARSTMLDCREKTIVDLVV